jgi:lipoprotein-anchoring transpeptidase ErfK/SrfK
MREFSVAAALAAALLVAGEARAQGALYQPASGQYGGGFIEMLMTGRDPGLAARPVRPAPLSPEGRPYGPPPRAPYAYGPPPAEPAYGPAGGAYRPVPGLEDDAAMVEPAPSYGPGPAYGPGPSYGYPAPPQGYGPRPRASVAPAPRMAEPDGRYRKQEVAYDGPHRPGTVVIDTPSRHLYLVQGNGRALRYGIGVGRPGFTWAGVKTVSQKREWPDWTPPAEMLKRRPDLPRHMAGGPDNPLGARALYLGSTLYRIHGTNEPHTIGQSVSSGCIRMMNDDVVDLYERVPVGAKVIVI